MLLNCFTAPPGIFPMRTTTCFSSRTNCGTAFRSKRVSNHHHQHKPVGRHNVAQLLYSTAWHFSNAYYYMLFIPHKLWHCIQIKKGVQPPSPAQTCRSSQCCSIALQHRLAFFQCVLLHAFHPAQTVALHSDQKGCPTTITSTNL